MPAVIPNPPISIGYILLIYPTVTLELLFTEYRIAKSEYRVINPSTIPQITTPRYEKLKNISKNGAPLKPGCSPVTLSKPAKSNEITPIANSLLKGKKYDGKKDVNPDIYVLPKK